MTLDSSRRAIERRVLRLLDDGVNEEEIARRFRRSPQLIHRLIAWAGLPRSESVPQRQEILRPLERRVLHWRDGGAAYGEIGSRFRRSDAFVQRVEGLARYKLAKASPDLATERPGQTGHRPATGG